MFKALVIDVTADWIPVQNARVETLALRRPRSLTPHGTFAPAIIVQFNVQPMTKSIHKEGCSNVRIGGSFFLLQIPLH